MSYILADQTISLTPKVKLEQISDSSFAMCLAELEHTWRPIVFIQPGVQDMSIIICAFKISIEWY